MVDGLGLCRVGGFDLCRVDGLGLGWADGLGVGGVHGLGLGLGLGLRTLCTLAHPSNEMLTPGSSCIQGVEVWGFHPVFAQILF